MNDMSGKTNAIYKYYDGSASLVTSGLGYINGLAVSDTDGTKFAYSADTDGTLSTTNDLTVFEYSDGKATAFPKKNETAYFSPEYVDIGGKEVLVASDGQNICYQSEGELKEILADAQSPGSVSYLPDANGLRLVWTDGTSIFTGVYSGEPIGAALAHTAADESYGSLSFTNYGGRLLGVGMRKNLDEDGSVTGVDLCSFELNDFIDLGVVFDTPDEEIIERGGTAPVFAYVINYGSKDAEGAKVTVKDSAGNEKTVTYSGTIRPGETVDVDATYTVSDNFNGTPLTVSVRPAVGKDTNPENNSAEGRIGVPDITVIERDIMEDDENFYIPACVVGKSYGAAKNAKAELVPDSLENEAAQTVELPELGRGDSVDIGFTVPKELLSFNEDGEAHVFIRVSCDDEDNTADNNLSFLLKPTTNKETERHELTRTAEKAPTCTEPGNVEYYTCSICGMTFSDADGAEQIYDVTVDAAGHKLVKTEAKAPTCTEAGNAEYYTCSVCGKSFSDAEGAKEIKDVTVKAAGHKLVKTAAKAPTCTAAGNVEYYTCSVCKKKFSDAKGTKEISDVTVKAAGHKLVKTKAKAPTCTEAGNVEYYTCSVCKKKFSDAEGTKEITDVTVKAKGHSFGEWTETKKATLKEKGTEARKCFDCGYEETRKTEKLKRYTPGDVNGNGEVLADDARLALRFSAKLEELDETQQKAADVDGNGDVLADDARQILRFSAKLQSEFDNYKEKTGSSRIRV